MTLLIGGNIYDAVRLQQAFSKLVVVVAVLINEYSREYDYIGSLLRVSLRLCLSWYT